MNIWKELETYLSRRPSNNTESCQKLLQGPAGELAGLEHLIIDRMAHLIFVISYKPLSEEECSQLAAILQKAYPGHFLRIQVRGNGQSEDVFLSGEIPEEVKIREGDNRYMIHPRRGQNIGFFPDMINGRSKVREYLEGQGRDGKVLNLFAYTCSFSVTALTAGASRVDNWDMNRNSLNIGKENHTLNSLELNERTARFYSHDIFRSFGKIRQNGPYDLIIMDPPPFQGRSFSFKRDYPKLIRRTGQWLKQEGAAFFCLNAPTFDWDEFETMLKENLDGNFENWERVPSPAEFLGKFPDRGLKAFFLTGWEVTPESKKNS